MNFLQTFDAVLLAATICYSLVAWSVLRNATKRDSHMNPVLLRWVEIFEALPAVKTAAPRTGKK